MTEIILKAKNVTKNGLEFVQVKRGNNKVAEIYPSNKWHDDFQVVVNGCASYHPNLEKALEFVRANQENAANSLTNFQYSFKIDKSGLTWE